MSVEPDRTSASLLERVRRPDDQASWDEFHALYAPLVHLWGQRLAVPAADRDDLVQAVFTTLLAELPGFRYDPARRFRGFLFTVTRSRAADLRRRSQPTEQLIDPPGPDPLEADIEADYRRHMTAQIRRLLARDFDPTYRTVFDRYVVNGEPAAAVAAQLGIAVGLVYQIKSRVLNRLRAEFDGLLD